MNILLTGATGFLGSFLLERLLSVGYSVVVLKRSTSNTRRINHLLGLARCYEIDRADFNRPFEEQKIDAVIHVATHYGRGVATVQDIVETNLMFSLKLLESAALFNVSTFINTDTLLPKGLNHYTVSKKQFVEWLHRFDAQIQIINLRLEHMYGPNDDDSKFVTWLIRQLICNVPSIDLTEGKQKRDFIYIDDVVDAYMLMLDQSKEFERFSEFDVATGTQIMMKEFVDKIYEKYSLISPIQTKLNFGARSYRKGELMEVEENLDPIYNLGWSPKISLDEGIDRVIDYERILRCTQLGK